MRLAERNGQRELRAARLARLRAGPGSAGGRRRPGRARGGADAAGCSELAARSLPAGGRPPAAVPAALPASTGFPGPARASVAALRRAGLGRLADLARLEPAALAARLGPIGRLIPAARWIAVARAEAPATQDAAAADARAATPCRCPAGPALRRSVRPPAQAAMFASCMAIASSTSGKYQRLAALDHQPRGAVAADRRWRNAR